MNTNVGIVPFAASTAAKLVSKTEGVGYAAAAAKVEEVSGSRRNQNPGDVKLLYVQADCHYREPFNPESSHEVTAKQ